MFSVPSQSAGGWAGRNAGEMTNLSVSSSPGWSPMQLANSTVASRRRRSRWCELGFNRVALVSHLCLTGLPDVAVPYSDMWQDCQITFPHSRPSRAIRSVDPQTLHGNVHQVDHVPNGPTNSAAIRHETGSHFVTQRPSDPGIQRPGDPVDLVTRFCNELQMSTYV